MLPTHPHTRRTFLKSSLIGVGALSLGLPRFAIGASGTSPNHKLNLAFIGVGGIATGAIPGCSNENLIAFCDVDEISAATNYQKFPHVPRYKDFRRMLDKHAHELDGVVISTPDHTHFPATMDAMERGLNVFVQKPLAHDIWQVRTLKKAAHHHKLVTQMGNQGHSNEGIRHLKEWYDMGLLGEVREVYVWIGFVPNRNKDSWNIPSSLPPATQKVPSTIDWDLWQGPVPETPYSDFYVPKNWRAWWNYGTGALGDFGCHAIDAPHWILGLKTPEKVEVTIDPVLDPKLVVPNATHLTYHFGARGEKPPVKLEWHDGSSRPKILKELQSKGLKFGDQAGVLIVGDNNIAHCSPWAASPQILLPNGEWNELRRTLPRGSQLSTPLVKGGPHQEWIRAIKGEGPPPGSNFDVSTELSEIVLTGVLAQRANRTIEYDGAGDMLKITNTDEHNELLKDPVRKGWDYGNQYWA